MLGHVLCWGVVEMGVVVMGEVGMVAVEVGMADGEGLADLGGLDMVVG